jgi:predicted SnoaL-like aldol condensation-catalyzing enzyme
MDRKAIAQDFLTYARNGDRIAAERLTVAAAKHHNPYFGAGMPTLLDAIGAASKTFPDRKVDVQRILSDGDYVAIHSHVRHRPEDVGIAVVHIFRFEGDKIAELWDVGQPVPAENKNADGMF